MRNLWTQREIIEMANFLQIQGGRFSNGSLNHWRDEAKIFSQPVSSEKGMYSFYKTEDVITGLIKIARRTRPPVEVNQEDIEIAMQHVLESNKSKYVTRMLQN
jgi:hypothetical protein